MRFLLHGPVNPEVPAALASHGHGVQTVLDLSEDTTAPEGAADDPRTLLPLLEKKQWSLLTLDPAFVHQLYEQKVQFANAIVLILDDPDDLHDQGAAITRLFERYKRLTPRRLYTVTRSRVKIRQLPGAAQAV
jgi:hypothetical protein